MPQIGRGQDAFESQPCIGMFGTCGQTTFRDRLFIPVYEELKINYFNPQVDDWKPEDAKDEADHLVHDMVQTWPVTSDTYGSGSVAEQGYSIAASLRSDSPYPKFVIPMLEMELDDSLSDEIARNESLRARRLARAHLERSSSPNVIIVESLDQMLETSLALYGAARAIVEVYGKGFNPSFERFMRARDDAAAYREAMERGLTQPLHTQ